MALSSNLNRKVFIASASQTAFAFGDVLYFDQTHLKVYVDGVLKTLSTHYTVSPTTNTPNGTPGGTVTFLTPMVGGEQVIILREVPLVQGIDYQENEKFPANTHEKGLDWLTMVTQQHNEKFGRSLVLPVTSTKSGVEFPDLIAANAGRVVRIKGDYSALEAVDMGTTPYASVLTTKGDLPTYASAQARLPVGTDGQLLMADSALSNGIGWKSPSSTILALDKLFASVSNPIINGNMEVWQRGITANAPASFAAYNCADRWKYNSSGTTAVATLNRSTNVPTVAQAGVLFNYSFEVDVTTADAAVAAGDLFQIMTKIEGYNWRHFAQREFTLSFWVMSTVTGTYSVAFGNSNGDRRYIGSYTIDSADTWEYKSITVPASPSTGTWDYTNGQGLYVSFALMCGSSWLATPGSWLSASSAEAATGQANAMSSTSNFFRFTGVKMELGPVATPHSYRSFQEELLLCQRYYQKSFAQSIAPAQNAGDLPDAFRTTSPVGASTIIRGIHIPLYSQMRTSPSVTFYNPSAANAQFNNNTVGQDCSSTGLFSSAGVSSLDVQTTTSASTAAGNRLIVHWAADAEL